MTIAIFGLGKMGAQIARRLHRSGFEVLAWNRSQQPRDEFNAFVQRLRIKDKRFGAESKAFDDIGSLINQMRDRPRIFWLMLPHEITGEFLEKQLLSHLKADDILIDGGNSYYRDSISRSLALAALGVHFFDCGASGGIWGEKNGFALMVGGPAPVWPKIEPIFKVLSSGHNYGLVGQTGAGHFVKMVHNGIEYGMMEAIGEGYGVLKASEFNLDLAQVTKIYQQGTVIRSWLIDLVRDIIEKENVDAVKGIIEASGEGEWTVKTARELGVDVRVIEDALAVRRESSDKKNQQKFSNKLLALLRKQFGGHEVEKR